MGTPAEEGGGGKILMAGKGAFDDIDLALMIHPYNRTHPFLPTLAVQEMELIFSGRAAHAAISPDTGINALDAAVLTYTAVSALRQQLKDDVRIHGVFTDGGGAVNVIPDRAALKYGVRTRYQGELASLVQKIIECANGAAIATGASLKVEKNPVFYEAFKDNQPLLEAIRSNLDRLGIPIDPPREGSGGLGSVDMGNISRMMPSAHVYLAICDPEIELHTPEFRAAADSERRREMLLKGSELLAHTACDVLTNADLLQNMRQYFQDNP